MDLRGLRLETSTIQLFAADPNVDDSFLSVVSFGFAPAVVAARLLVLMLFLPFWLLPDTLRCF